MHYLKVSCISAIFVLIPLTSFAHNNGYSTVGISNFKSMANLLRGTAPYHAEKAAYCDLYANIARRQAQQRRQHISQCGSTTHSTSRWTAEHWEHRNWCMNVSPYASERETLAREQKLNQCVSHTHPVSHHACTRNNGMHAAAKRGDVGFLSRCLNAGVSVDVREQSNWTPLHTAGRYGQLAVVKLLLRHGASINAPDVTGRTPLDQANYSQNYQVAEYLRLQGGRPRANF